MRNLIYFFWKRYVTILFIVLELFAFVLLFQYNKFHKAGFLNFTSAVSGTTYNLLNNITEYFELKKINEQLAHENAELQTMNKNAFVKLKGYIVSINDTLYKQKYKYLGAKVVNSTVHRRNNFLILNKGLEQGVEPEMGVISPKGVVGIVKDVAGNYSSVISVLHKDSRISARIKKNNYFGIVVWNGEDPQYANLLDIPRHVKLVKGDAIITRGSSTIFPEGVDIGTIEEFYPIEGSNFYHIKVKLSTDFNNVAHVYVVRNLMKQEQVFLETKITEE